MKKVRMYSTATCPFCLMAKRLLAEKGAADLDEIRVDSAPQMRAQMREETGRWTVPQIFIGEFHIGGCNDLFALEKKGELDKLLEAQNG